MASPPTPPALKRVGEGRLLGRVWSNCTLGPEYLPEGFRRLRFERDLRKGLPRRATARFLANAEPRMGQGDSVASRGKARKSGRQCKEEGSAGRFGLHRLPLGPQISQALEKCRNPSLVPVPSPTQLPAPVPLFPSHPSPLAASQAFPPPATEVPSLPVSTRVLRRELTRR